MVFKDKELIVEGKIRLRKGISISELDAMMPYCSYMYKHEAGQAYVYFRIDSVTSADYLVEIRVHFIFDVLAYITFTTLNESEEGIKDRYKEMQLTYYRNNRLVERLIANMSYQWKIYESRIKFILDWGYIISRYDQKELKSECLLSFAEDT